MNKRNQSFVGIDVSRLTFDAALTVVTNHQRGTMLHQCFENTAEGLEAFKKWLKANGSADFKQMLVVFENTGVYHRRLWEFCSSNSIFLHIGNAAHIKKSLGITRGKDDVTDSKRLCDYAIKNGDELKAAPSPSPVLLKLKDLWTLRSRLLCQLSANRAALGELKATGCDKKTYDL